MAAASRGAKAEGGTTVGILPGETRKGLNQWVDHVVVTGIGAAARNNGLTYGQLIHGLKAAGVSLDRKILADIAVKDAAAFTSLVASAKAAAPPQAKATKS